MTSQETSGFGTFGFDIPSNDIESAFGWGEKSINNFGFELLTPVEDKRTKDQIIEDLKIQLKSQEEESKKQKYHIDN